MTGKTLKLLISVKQTVEELIAYMHASEGYPCGTQRLIVAGKQLENDRSLKEYNITNNSTLHLVLRLRGGGPFTFTILVEFNGNSKQMLNVLAVYTIRDIKCLINACKKIPEAHQILIYNGQKLQDDQPLRQLCMSDGCIIKCLENKPIVANGEDHKPQLLGNLESLDLSGNKLRHYVYYNIFHSLSLNFKYDWESLAFVLLKKCMSDDDYGRFMKRMSQNCRIICKGRISEVKFEIFQQWKLRETGDHRAFISALTQLSVMNQEEMLKIKTMLQYVESKEKQIDIDPLSDEGLHNLSEDIGDEWQNIGLGLGMKKARLEQLRDNHRDLKTVISYMLIEWRDKTSFSKEEKIEKLKDTLTTNGKAELTWFM